MLVLIASLILSITGVYVAFLSIFYNLYLNARYKIEESSQYFRSDYKYIPTEEQLKIVEEGIFKYRDEQKTKGVGKEARFEHYDMNVKRCKLITKILNIMTFGKFKHLV